jgi:site-specific DNA recombinase
MVVRHSSKDKVDLVPAAGYLRRSGDDDTQADSIPEQRRAVQEYADAHGYRVIRWYVDDAISGDDTARRVGFLKMLKDAQTLRDFKAILTWDQARFGRFNSLEFGYYVFPLCQAGIYLVTTQDGVVDWEGSTGRIANCVKQEGRHQQLLDHSANVTRGQLNAVKAGSWVGCPPYAYRLEGPRKHKRLVLDDPAKALVVRRIFREFVEGRTMKEIARRLNAEGYVSPSGRVKGWRRDTIKVILRNPAYAGDFFSGKSHAGKYHTARLGVVSKAVKRCLKPVAEWLVIRDHHEAIVDRPTFEKAQSILDRGRTLSPRYTSETNPYVLSGLLRCGLCGAPLHGIADKRYRYYECANSKRNGTEACPGTTVREDRVLHSIARALDDQFISLDGDGRETKEDLAWRAERRELQPGDLPAAFHKVRDLVCPPEQPGAAKARAAAAKQAKALDLAIERRAAIWPWSTPRTSPPSRRKFARCSDSGRSLPGC